MAEGRLPDKTAEAFWNRLYRNNGDGTFTDVTEKAGVRGAGYGMGVAAADYDNDGRTDFYVTGFGRNTLYHNNGDGTFTDVTVEAGVGGGGWSAGALFIDYDRDGLLDLVVTRYLKWDFSMNVFLRRARAAAVGPIVIRTSSRRSRTWCFTTKDTALQGSIGEDRDREVSGKGAWRVYERFRWRRLARYFRGE